MKSSQKPDSSEVARLLEQIRLEYEAAYAGLSGLASGASRHAFIERKFDTMGKLHDELKVIVGERAIELVVEQLNTVADTHHANAL